MSKQMLDMLIEVQRWCDDSQKRISVVVRELGDLIHRAFALTAEDGLEARLLLSMLEDINQELEHLETRINSLWSKAYLMKEELEKRSAYARQTH